MNKLLPKTTLFLFLFIIAIAIFWLPTQADEPTAVHLASFNVVPLNNAARIDWETATELGTAGFRIKRATPNGNGEFLDYVGDNGFIPATGDVMFGSNYTATDNQVQNGEAYTYILIELENSGTETELARATVTVGILPTNTPVVISGGIGGNNATSTPRATATPRTSTAASATPVTNSNATAPTNTPPSFVTVTPKSVQPTAAPTRDTNTANTNQTNNTTTTDSADETDHYEEITNSSITGVTEVLAQEDSSETTDAIEIAANTDSPLIEQTQNDYPGGTATAVSIPDETYPNNATNNSTEPTPVPIIGSSNQGNTDTPTNTTSSSGTDSPNQGQVFLWLGFIVALLIFATGLIGSIILFTRKSK